MRREQAKSWRFPMLSRKKTGNPEVDGWLLHEFTAAHPFNCNPPTHQFPPIAPERALRNIHKDPGLKLSWMMKPTLWFVFNKNWRDTLGFAWSFYWKNIHRYTNLWLDFRVGSWYWYLQEHANLGSVDHWYMCLKTFAFIIGMVCKNTTGPHTWMGLRTLMRFLCTSKMLGMSWSGCHRVQHLKTTVFCEQKRFRRISSRVPEV